jgi:hypothetical protein
MARRARRILTGDLRFKAVRIPDAPCQPKPPTAKAAKKAHDFDRGPVTPEETSEHEEQSKFMAILRTLPLDAAKGVFAIPNGFLRTKAMRIRAWREGVHPGVPDVFIPFASKGFHGLFLEFKSLKGTLSKPQTEYLNLARARGYKAEVVRSAEHALRVFSEYIQDATNTF